MSGSCGSCGSCENMPHRDLINIFMEYFTDEYGLKYLAKLPENTREATLDDFHVHGRKKIGMEFFILGFYWPVYQLYMVTESLTGKFLEPFIKDHRVFIVLS